MKIYLKIWRQKNKNTKGKFERYTLNDISESMSFLEMLDFLNNKLVSQKKEAVAFDSDCREGICGMCGLFINGRAHGPIKGTTFSVLKKSNISKKDFSNFHFYL